MSESEAFEAGMSLPSDARRRLAIRLLESLDVTDEESVDGAWTSEIATRIDDMRSGKVKTVPGQQVFADIAAHRAARNAGVGGRFVESLRAAVAHARRRPGYWRKRVST